MPHEMRAADCLGRRWLALAFILISTAGIESSCKASVTAGLDAPTRQVLQNGIDQLGNQPGAWQTTMQNTIEKLGKIGTETAKQVLAEVQATFNGALGQMESATKCSLDFVGHRLQQRMQAILHKFDANAPAPAIVPVICTTDPATHLVIGKNDFVTYYGYDFLEFRKTNAFSVDLQYANGAIVKKNFGTVAVPHNYELTVSLQGQQYPALVAAQGPQLVLKWSDQKVLGEGGTSELALLFPPPAIPPTAIPTTLQIVTCGPFGGGGGGTFNEPFKTNPTGVRLSGGQFIDSIQVLYATGPGSQWGGGGGGPVAINFSVGEYVQGLAIRSGQYVDSISIQTNNRTLGPYGGTGGATNPMCGGPGWQVIGIFGRSGQYLDALGVALQRR